MSDASPAQSRANRVPVSVITGFLGSGKTTLLNRLVRHPGMADTALIVNEFGEIGIDHELVDSAFENTVLMESGCICCSIRGDLIDTITDLFANAEQGNIPHFSRILVETTGLADPVPVVHALKASEPLIGRCTLGSVITTVDGQQGLSELAQHEEVARQIATADVIVITKTDIAGDGSVRELRRQIHTLNPGVPIRTAVQGEIDPEELFKHGAGGGLDAEEIFDTPEPHPHDDHDHDHHHDHDHAHDHEHENSSVHGSIAAHAISTEAPLAWDRLRLFLETVFSLRGNAFLRMKGIVQLQGADKPVVVQGVGNSFNQPYTLNAWPDGPCRSRLVFIYEGIEARALDETFARLVLEPSGTQSNTQ